MPGFTTNNESVHQANSRTGFRNAGKGKRHRWDLSQKAPKPGTSKPKSPKLKALEDPMSMDDGDGMDLEDPMDEMSEMSAPPVTHAPKAHKPAPPVSVVINLSPKEKSAFRGMQSRKHGKH